MSLGLFRWISCWCGHPEGELGESDSLRCNPEPIATGEAMADDWAVRWLDGTGSRVIPTHLLTQLDRKPNV